MSKQTGTLSNAIVEGLEDKSQKAMMNAVASEIMSSTDTKLEALKTQLASAGASGGIDDLSKIEIDKVMQVFDEYWTYLNTNKEAIMPTITINSKEYQLKDVVTKLSAILDVKDVKIKYADEQNTEVSGFDITFSNDKAVSFAQPNITNAEEDGKNVDTYAFSASDTELGELSFFCKIAKSDDKITIGTKEIPFVNHALIAYSNVLLNLTQGLSEATAITTDKFKTTIKGYDEFVASGTGSLALSEQGISVDVGATLVVNITGAVGALSARSDNPNIVPTITGDAGSGYKLNVKSEGPTGATNAKISVSDAKQAVILEVYSAVTQGG